MTKDFKETLNEAGLKTVHVDINFQARLEKHLQENEEICGRCGGSGMMVEENPFGIVGVKTQDLFPFHRQSISFCKHCYNGVVSRCEYCSKLVSRGYKTCDCDKARAAKENNQVESVKEYWNTVPKIRLEEAIKSYGMLYVQNFEEFIVSGDIYNWIERKKENDNDFDLATLMIYVTRPHSISVTAKDIVDMVEDELHEDADIPKKSMDKLQDFLTVWCKENETNTLTYYIDDSIGVLIGSDSEGEE